MININVVSLFDGISCGMLALIKSGIKVNKYISYEIDKYAIKVSNRHFLYIEQKGSVVGADFTEYKGFDLLIGGPLAKIYLLQRQIDKDYLGVGAVCFSNL